MDERRRHLKLFLIDLHYIVHLTLAVDVVARVLVALMIFDTTAARVILARLCYYDSWIAAISVKC